MQAQITRETQTGQPTNLKPERGSRRPTFDGSKKDSLRIDTSHEMFVKARHGPEGPEDRENECVSLHGARMRLLRGTGRQDNAK